ncbi:glutamic acid-rich protein-like [Ambystoma mexicanum]|uniref:glutamic acid-rich protein-like n=1 Tax=Ambystoma mexicanum TaxID=8296 RepID=UPI0037E96FBD
MKDKTEKRSVSDKQPKSNIKHTPKVVLILNKTTSPNEQQEDGVATTYKMFDKITTNNEVNKGNTRTRVDNNRDPTIDRNDEEHADTAARVKHLKTPMTSPKDMKLQRNRQNQMPDKRNEKCGNQVAEESVVTINQGGTPELEDTLMNVSVYTDDVENPPITPGYTGQLTKTSHRSVFESSPNSKKVLNKVDKERDFETLEEKRNRLIYHVHNIEKKKRDMKKQNSVSNEKTKSELYNQYKSSDEEVNKHPEQMRKKSVSQEGKLEYIHTQYKPQHQRQESKREQQRATYNRGTTTKANNNHEKRRNQSEKRSTAAQGAINRNTRQGRRTDEDIKNVKINNKRECRWMIKITQRSCNKEEVILNRRTILDILHQMRDLRHIISEDIQIVEPWHTRKGAVALLYLNSSTICRMIEKHHNDFYNHGYHIEEITINKHQANIEANTNKSEIKRENKKIEAGNNMCADQQRGENLQKEHKRTQAYKVAQRRCVRDNRTQNKESEMNKHAPTQRRTGEQYHTTKAQRSQSDEKVTIRSVTQRVDKSPSAQKKEAPQNFKTGLWGWLPKALSRRYNK